MEIKFSEKPCRFQRTAVNQTSQREQTQELRLEDGMPDIGRVLGCWGRVSLRGKEWRGGELGISGGVTARVLYRPEDGSENRILDAWIPFQQRWEHPDSGRDGFLWVSPRLCGVDARMISARKLMLRATVSTWVRAMEPEQLQLPVPHIPEEDVQLLTLDYPIALPVEAGERLVQIDEPLPQLPQQAQVLHLWMEPTMTEEKIIGTRLVFRGCGNLRLLWLDGDSVRTLEAELPFSQYGDLDGEVSPAATAEVLPVVTELELESREDGRYLKAELAAQYLLSDRTVVTLAQDAYSCCREVTPQIRELSLPALLEKKQLSVTATAQWNGDVSAVVDVTSLPEHPVRRGDGMAVPGVFQLLYRDGEGNLQSAAVGFEAQWPLPAGEDTRLDGKLLRAQPPQATVTGDGVKLTQELLVETAATGLPRLTALEGMELGERKTPDPARPSVILRRCGDEALWDIAKSCGSTVEAIRQANHFETEPAENQMLLIPVL